MNVFLPHSRLFKHFSSLRCTCVTHYCLHAPGIHQLYNKAEVTLNTYNLLQYFVGTLGLQEIVLNGILTYSSLLFIPWTVYCGVFWSPVLLRDQEGQASNPAQGVKWVLFLFVGSTRYRNFHLSLSKVVLGSSRDQRLPRVHYCSLGKGGRSSVQMTLHG